MKSFSSFLLALPLALLCTPVWADEDRSPVTWLRDPGHEQGELVPGAYSILDRDCDGISINIHTTTLRPADEYTVWWVVFNNPDQCANPFHCAGTDLSNPAVQGSVLYASGRTANWRGVANFQADLQVGDVSGCQPEVIGFPCNPLLNPLEAEVHVVVRNHGPPIAGYVCEQTSSFAGGCEGDPEPPFLHGGNPCFDSQASAHSPPE